MGVGFRVWASGILPYSVKRRASAISHRFGHDRHRCEAVLSFRSSIVKHGNITAKWKNLKQTLYRPTSSMKCTSAVETSSLKRASCLAVDCCGRKVYSSAVDDDFGIDTNFIIVSLVTKFMSAA